jgi:hypothetical protein
VVQIDLPEKARHSIRQILAEVDLLGPEKVLPRLKGLGIAEDFDGILRWALKVTAASLRSADTFEQLAATAAIKQERAETREENALKRLTLYEEQLLKGDEALPRAYHNDVRDAMQNQITQLSQTVRAFEECMRMGDVIPMPVAKRMTAEAVEREKMRRRPA